MNTKEQAEIILLQLNKNELTMYLSSLEPANKLAMLIHKRQSGDILFKHFMFHHPTLLVKCLTDLDYKQKRKLFNIRDKRTEAETVLESFNDKYGKMNFALSPDMKQTYHATITMGGAVRQPSPAEDFRRSLRTLTSTAIKPTLLATLQTYKSLQKHHPLWYASKREQRRKIAAADKLIQALKTDTVPDTIYLNKNELNALSKPHWLTRRSALVQLYRAFRNAHPQCQFVTDQTAAEIDTLHEETKVENSTPAPEQKISDIMDPTNAYHEVAPHTHIQAKPQKTAGHQVDIQWTATLWLPRHKITKHSTAEEKQPAIEMSPTFGK
ncbi:MAG: hypothetical protein P1U63_04995 [Coxiellaceae bacterium]|nr:hypothetical protein [Coxiellaceae bacterium]